jgi:hypothetical protein
MDETTPSHHHRPSEGFRVFTWEEEEGRGGEGRYTLRSPPRNRVIIVATTTAGQGFSTNQSPHPSNPKLGSRSDDKTLGLEAADGNITEGGPPSSGHVAEVNGASLALRQEDSTPLPPTQLTRMVNSFGKRSCRRIDTYLTS